MTAVALSRPGGDRKDRDYYDSGATRSGRGEMANPGSLEPRTKLKYLRLILQHLTVIKVSNVQRR